jgi:hypothetical protein
MPPITGMFRSSKIRQGNDAPGCRSSASAASPFSALFTGLVTCSSLSARITVMVSIWSSSTSRIGLPGCFMAWCPPLAAFEWPLLGQGEVEGGCPAPGRDSTQIAPAVQSRRSCFTSARPTPVLSLRSRGVKHLEQLEDALVVAGLRCRGRRRRC